MQNLRISEDFLNIIGSKPIIVPSRKLRIGERLTIEGAFIKAVTKKDGSTIELPMLRLSSQMGSVSEHVGYEFPSLLMEALETGCLPKTFLIVDVVVENTSERSYTKYITSFNTSLSRTIQTQKTEQQTAPLNA